MGVAVLDPAMTLEEYRALTDVELRRLNDVQWGRVAGWMPGDDEGNGRWHAGRAPAIDVSPEQTGATPPLGVRAARVA